MAEKFGEGPIILKPPILSRRQLERVATLEDMMEELESIQNALNDNYSQVFSAMRSMQVLLDQAFDRNGNIKKQISHQDVQKDSIRPECCEPCMKPFVSDITFMTTYQYPIGTTNPGVRLYWCGDKSAGTNSHLYFGDWDTGIYTEAAISPGTYSPLSSSTTTYFYIEPRVDPHPTIGTIYTLKNNTGTVAFIDGNIVLCAARRTMDNSGAWANIEYEHIMWGGGIHICY